MESYQLVRRWLRRWLRNPRPSTLIRLLIGVIVVTAALALLHEGVSDAVHVLLSNVIGPWLVGIAFPWLTATIALPGWLLVTLLAVAAVAVGCAYIILRLHVATSAEQKRLAAQLRRERDEAVKAKGKLQLELNTAQASLDVLAATQRGLERTIKTFLETAQKFAGGQPVEQTVQSLIPVIISELKRVYKGQVFRGGILVPDRDEHDWLVWYARDYGAAINLTTTPNSPLHRYYIGTADVTKRTVAGQAWHTGKPQRCRVEHRTGEGDNPSYKPSLSFGPDEYPYASFIAIPLFDEFLKVERAGSEPEQYGILCLDSSDSTTFDSDALFAEDRQSDAFAMPFLREMFRLLRWASQSAEV